MPTDYRLHITWDHDSAMIGVNPDTKQQIFSLEGTATGGVHVKLTPEHRGMKMYYQLAFAPKAINEGVKVFVDPDNLYVGESRYTYMPLDEWPTAVPYQDGMGSVVFVDIETDHLFIMGLWPSVRQWAPDAGKHEEAAVDAEIKRDLDMTAKTPLISQVNVDATIARAKSTPDVGEWSDFAFLRSLAFRLAAERGITIYTQRWEGRKDGYDYTLLTDADELYGALVDYMRANKDS